MPILDESHDFAHPVEGDSAWSESYYFNAYDPGSDTGLFTRIGVRPNDGTMDVGLSVWLPGRSLASVHGVREQREMVDTGLSVHGVTYERLAPLKEWRLTCSVPAAAVVDLDDRLASSGPIELAMDVTFSALTPAVGVDGQGRPGPSGASASTAASVGKGHLEQAGRWTGWIEADGRRHAWGADARGNRDKSWGPRRWGGPQMWRWFSINIGDDVHFGGIRIATPAGDLHRGWVWKDGAATSIREWRVRSELADDGVTHTRSHVTALDKQGREHELHGDVMRVYGVPHRTGDRSTVVNEGLARWEYEGRTGYGIAEYLHQLDDDGRPLVPIE
ncbi:MAG: hypothetical protein JWO37_1118 [Acidimicrobiales bacterium]|nr:hypothetical protein [Acidimicrobiales bacterium]